ncbi:hypothetical protein O181_017806 [Austropuccinia psidii MF-1]|uniref:Uncharacterized protein n=1 Tax=Austropuccinia psidii MF-1 TaxID=1389203 RepID=A0A9Q3GSB7_9BASI|nr:hypothetical protein [Austropuccinia psidii MF-1]
MVHVKILKKCGGELGNALRSRFIEPCSTEAYIDALEGIVTRTKIGKTWRKLDMKITNKPFIKNDKPKKKIKFNKTNEQINCHKCGCIENSANNCLKKAKNNEIVGKEDHNEEKYGPYRETEELETS